MSVGACYDAGMKFIDVAIDSNGLTREGFAPGVQFISDDGAWRITASDPHRPDASEWLVWQHVDPGSPRADSRNWRRRLPWVRLRHVEEARVVAISLAALPASASWETARVALRNALRTVGAALFFRSVHSYNQRAAALLARLRARGPSTDDIPEDPQDAGA